jgi:pyruvate/2-oxoacid:ferredoxin oxidoreductase beta subunit
MDRLDVKKDLKIRRQEYPFIPDEDVLQSGHLSCPGCCAALSVKLALKALGRRVIMAIPACCWAVCDGPFPYSASGIPVINCAFETAAITAAGIRAGLEVQGINDITVVAWAGDGGTMDIGIQALSGVAERNDDIIYVCYDNEAYMNTGIQRSSATPYLAWTTTTPPNMLPKKEPKKDMVEIMAAHKIPYIATLSVAFLDDFMIKFKKAKKIRGTRYLHIFAPCPTGWRTEERIAIKLARLAVETRLFPLIEIENGEKYILNYQPKGIPVKEYLRLQGRFRHLKEEDINFIQKETDRNWQNLLKKFRDDFWEERP